MRTSKSRAPKRPPKATKVVPKTLLLGLCGFLFGSTCVPVLARERASGLVAGGNRYYEQRKYPKAELLYRDAQKLLPESPEINFNLGDVAYRKGDYDAAEEHFNTAAESPDAARQLRKKALYNLGNCAFMKGEKLLDSDLQKALDYYKLSILRYHDVVAKDEYDRLYSGEKEFKSDEDAKYNIEVARLRIKDILDKLKQQEEKKKEERKQQEEFVKKLKEAIEKQEQIVKGTGDARQQKQQGQDVSGAVGDLKKTQDENKKTTKELAEELQKKIDAGSATPGGGQLSPAVGQDVLAAENSLKEAEIEQGTAIQHLDREGLAEAENSEKLALQDLQSALDKLTKSQQPQPQAGGETEQKQQPRESQPEQKQQQPGKEGETKDRERKEITSQEAQEELAKLRNQTSEMRKKELENFLRRHPEYRDRRIKHEPVDKDW